MLVPMPKGWRPVGPSALVLMRTYWTQANSLLTCALFTLTIMSSSSGLGLSGEQNPYVPGSAFLTQVPHQPSPDTDFSLKIDGY